MVNIDQLNIQITASSNEATNALDRLVTHLRKLNKQLGLTDGTKFSKTLNTMAESINKFTDSMSGFKTDGFEKASESAKSASEFFKESTEQAERFKDALSKILETEKSFAQRKLFESDLGKSSNLNDYTTSTKQEPVLALPMFEKMLPAITQANDALNGLKISFEDVITTADGVDVVTQKFIDWKSQVQEIENNLDGARSKFTFADPHWDAKGDYHSADVTAWISNINPQVVDGYFYEIEESANKCLPAIQNVGTTALATAEQFKVVGDYAQQSFENTAKSWGDFSFPWKEVEENKPFENVAESANKASESIKDVIEQVQKYRTLISGFESGKIPFVESGYQDALKGYAEASNKLKNYKDKFEIKTPDYTSVLTALDALSRALGEVSEKFGMVGDKGIQMFKFLTTPLKAAASEYVEKFKTMSDGVVSFQKNFKAQMKKVSDFWKRTMRTFTFMIVRKAFTAIIKEIGNAIQSLAMYSNAMGTAFNTDISLMVADFQYLGRSIVSVFAPLLNYIAPIIDAIVDKIATLLSYIGMLFAALGGSTSFTKAKKNVGNYAESLDNASKSAKNLTMGIDELNILSESQGSSSSKPYDGWEDAWEDVKIPDWILSLADWFKDLWDKIFAPLKKAWERVKERFLAALNFLKTNLLYLFSSIGDAFLKVWNEEATIKIFENILHIIADVMIIIGVLAKNFADAWNEADRGVRIFEGIRDIIGILVQHMVNLTDYMVSWAANITFAPLLDSVLGVLDAFKLLADFIGGVFENVMRMVVLKYIKWMIEEGLPHLNNTIKEVIESFDFQKIQDDLVPLEKAFERLAENIHTGTTNAIGNLGKEIAKFTNSEEFTKFLQRLADIMDLISAEDVEKVLTGISIGILRIGEKLVKFVNSDTFMSFLEGLDKWLEDATAEDIADLLERIAFAIGLFKFAEFATAGLSGFFQFATILKSFENLQSVATNLSGIATKLGVVGAQGTVAGAGTTVASGGFAALTTTALPIIGILALVVAAVYSLIQSYGGLDGTCQEIIKRFEEVKERLEIVKKALHFDQIIDNLKDAFSRLGEKLGDMKSWWDTVFDIVQDVATLFGGAFICALEGVVIAVTVVLDILSTLVDVLGGVGTMIKGVFDGDWDEIKQGATRVGTAIVDGVKDGISQVKHAVSTDVTNGVNEGIAEVPDNTKTAITDASNAIASTQASSLANSIASYTPAVMQSNSQMYNDMLGTVYGADYTGTSDFFVSQEYAELQSQIASTDFTSLGTQWNTRTGDALRTNSGLFTDANKETSEQGASTFSSTYMDYMTNSSLMGESMSQYGETVGKQLVDGMNNGLSTNMALTTQYVNEWFGLIQKSIHDNSFMPFGSPNKKTQEYGKDTVDGFNLGITTNASTTITAVNTWFTYINAAIRNKLVEVKTTFTTMLTEIFSGNGWDYNTPITTLFTNVTTAIISNLTLIGENLLGTQLPMFMETYIMPFFSVEMWQPLFDVLLNEVFMVNFTTFSEWFTTVMTEWWNVSLLSWFKTEKWNKEIFEPLKKNIQLHWNNFKKWWDTSIKDWWDKHLINPWFTNKKWDEDIFTPLKKNIVTHWKNFVNTWDTSMKDWWDNHVLPWLTKFLAYLTAVGQMTEEIVEDTFSQVEKSISDHMDKAKENVVNTANEMKNALQHVADVLEEIIEKLSILSGMGVDIHLLGFADGGFPSEGSLFFAGEQGAELIGNIGGKTAVASNDEITGIREAVYESGNQESALLAQLISIGTQLLDKETVVIGDRDIAMMANNGQSQLGMRIIT